MNLAKEVGERCRVSGTFTLRSGRTATEYFDPVLLDAIATALSRHTGLPCAFVRKQAKPYGTARLAEGADISGRRVLVVEDVVTSGGQVAISTRQLRDLGATIEHALCVIDREEGAEEALEQDRITLFSLFTRADLDAAQA